MTIGNVVEGSDHGLRGVWQGSLLATLELEADHCKRLHLKEISGRIGITQVVAF
jgi:hypothetical protein